MSHSFTSRKRIRKNYERHGATAQMPNLIEIQKKSYESFLQADVNPEERADRGLQAVFKSVFPIEDTSGQATLEFIKYEFDAPKYDVEECVQRDLTFSAPVRVTMRLIVWDVDEDAGTREIKGIKEQDVYVGDLPLMTVNGTFVVNGTERVIVSQMHRSPGVFFDHDKGKGHSSGKFLFSARIIPYRGSWLDFEFDAKDLLYFRIDRRRKQYVSSLLRALGMDTNEIISTFYSTKNIKKVAKGWSKEFDPKEIGAGKQSFAIIDAKSGKTLVEAGEKITPRKAKKMAEDGLKNVILSQDEMINLYLAESVVDKATGEVIADAASPITEEIINALEGAGIKEISIVDVPSYCHPYVIMSLAADKNTNRDESLIDIYKVMRPGEPPTVEAAETIFNNLFFDDDRYDLSDVGRMKINKSLGLNVDEDIRILRKEDIIEIIRSLINIKDGKGSVDDIDDLGNRRVRSVGELMENQFRIGLLRIERGILERMSTVEIDTVMPHDFINAKPLAAVVKEFFGSSQLSQFMDQTNPLSEITHKRRLSALGPGGLTRERAGFEVRDVHATHYGRICPIETPEGPNIGLINSLSTFARVNKYGFIETPYYKVKDGKVTNEIEYISAIEEQDCLIAQFDAQLDKSRKYTDELVNCRHRGDFEITKPENITHADVSPRQLVSVAAALIPFLENDDANRALMGSNMMRQAVPLLRQEAPLVGTGMEAPVARDSGAVITALNDGVIDQVDATRIVVKQIDEKNNNKITGVDVFNLHKFQRSNQNTCMNQTPLVKVGDKVKAGDIIADGASTDLGELALGYNVVAAFMPWNGYNYEDSILISERLVRDDIFTSIHIDEFETMARDTKLGPEEITCDIPNVGEENLRQLDETGIVHLGAEVEAGDILVGKVTPKSESPMTPEEKLLRAIFGEKAADVRDSSLRMKPGVGGRVVEVRIFSRRGIEKDERTMEIEREEIEHLTKDRNDKYKILSSHIFDSLKDILTSNEASKDVEGIKKGKKISADDIADIPNAHLWNIALKDEKAMDAIEELRAQHEKIVRELDDYLQNKISKIQDGDDLPSGVLKMVKVFVAVKRKLQPGDKMAGRHGNKGVISRILPIEDMPYLEDGREVDLVLNPLGVPSRMNVGQILETHLGWASREIGNQVGETLNKVKNGAKIDDLRKQIEDIYTNKDDKKEVNSLADPELFELANNLSNGLPIATPVFDGAKESDITEALQKAGFDASGQVQLYDGRTGEAFDRKTTVGIIYMIKLHHLVDDKIHARSIGPYSLVTQQPLGGKSHFGGQRFGEMECWALQAYGAAYTLQELLTIKSDDVVGRTKVYESIIKGDHTFDSGIPESFNVMVKELRSLCLNVELKQTAGE